MERLRAFWNRGWFAKVIVSIVGLLVVCCVIGILVPKRTTVPVANQPTAAAALVPDQPTAAPEPTGVPVPTDVPAPTVVPTVAASPTPEPSATPAPPTEVPVLADRVRAAVEAVLSRGNRKVERITTAVADPDQKNPQIFVRWTINDNLTEGLIKASARHDAVKILKAIAELGVDYSAILLEGTFPLVDKLGNSSESVVVHASYPKATIDKINWANFLSDNVYAVADDVTIHPAFRE